MRRAGGRCEARDAATGKRCTATQDLRACHTKVAVADGGSYENEDGELLCRKHDRETDSHAR